MAGSVRGNVYPQEELGLESVKQLILAEVEDCWEDRIQTESCLSLLPKRLSVQAVGGASNCLRVPVLPSVESLL